MISNISNAVAVSDGKVTTTSLKIAEVFGKLHKNILRDIESLQVPDNWHKLNFEPSSTTQKMPNGGTKNIPMYHITRDGFTILVMGFTGAKAMQFKIAYLEEFNRMEAKLRELQGAPVQPESPLPATRRPSFVPEAHYYGVPVISLQKLAELLGLSTVTIHNNLKFGTGLQIVDDVDLFRVKSRRELYAAGIPRDFHIGANNIDLFSRSGFEKIVGFCRPLPPARPGHAAPPAVPAVPAVVKTKPEPVRPLDLKLAAGRKTVESVTVSADKLYDQIAAEKDPLYEILRKLSQAGYDVREAMAELAYLSSCFFRTERLKCELLALLKTASSNVSMLLDKNLTIRFWLNDDRIVNQERC